MEFLKLLTVIFLIGAAVFVGLRILNQKPSAEKADAHGEAATGDDGSRRGPHGGRFFGTPEFECEVQIYEPEGVTPQFHVYFYKDGKPLDPKDVKLTITLERINRTEVVNFTRQGDYLLGDKDVVEPHSFFANVRAEYDGRKYEWKFDSIEGRTTLAPELVEKAGIEMVKTSPASIRETVSLRGLVRLNAERMSHVTPRFPGIVRTVAKNLGDTVKKGDVLATIESNESLQPYEIKAEIDGTIIGKDATLGGAVDSQRTLFTIADLSTVWLDFTVHRHDFGLLEASQPVSIDIGQDREPITARLDYISPLGAEASQTMLARSIVPNPEGLLRPGIFVMGTVTTESAEVPVAVKASALQTFRDWDVVFIRVGDTFEAVPIEIGRSDSEWVEVADGLPEGSEYAAENSFIIKADVMKSGATHDH